jgi:deoxyadenosine/deoxycytidine kinase
MILGRYGHVAVEGPIGAGKTSLARRLAGHFRVRLLLEKPEGNPFLPRFYENPARFALPTQLYFLFQRVGEVRELVQLDMFTEATVSDFILDKDLLFARLNLSDDEYDLYQQVWRHLQPPAAAPDLVLFLQARPEVLMQRVRRRGHDFERALGEEYLFRLVQAYGNFFHHYDAAPVLMVNSENLNPVENAADFDLLLERIERMRGPREYFSRGN